jgi:transmembrane sensor
MEEQALAWIARLRCDTAGESDHRNFALWLNANPEHRRAMDRMQELWGDLGAVAHLPSERLQPGRRQWLAGGLAAAAVLLVAILVGPRLALQAPVEVYRTGLGERLLVELPDGSRVTLNTRTQVAVAFDDEQRHVTLTQGEAYFEVVTGHRPFEVDAGTARVSVLGTAFNVYLQDQSSRVTVTEGVVRVTDRHNNASHAPAQTVLYPDQTVASTSDGLGRPEKISSAQVQAWRQGKLIADGMKLGELAEQLERYHARRILVADRDIASLAVSGVFQLDDPEATLHAVTHSLGLQLVELDKETVQLIR